MAPTDAGRAMTTDRTAIPIGVTGSVWSLPATAELTSNTAPSNVRPFILSVGRTENFLTTSPHHSTAADR